MAAVMSMSLVVASPRLSLKAKAAAPVARVARRSVVAMSAAKPETAALPAALAAGLAAMAALPMEVEAAGSPSLSNLLGSVVAGGVVLAAIAGAVITVSSFDRIRR